jgi:hypothetical protein
MARALVALDSGKQIARIAAILVMVGGCGRRVPSVDHGPKRLAILVDVSSSIGQTDVSRWRHQFSERVAELKAGDAIVMYPICGRSTDATPLLERQLPPIRREEGLGRVREAQRRVKETVPAAEAAFGAALARPTASRTDIFGALGRVPPGTTRLIVFSDMLHSEKGFDMERMRLSGAQVPKLVDRLVEEGRIKPDSLAGAEVWVYLNSVTVDERKRASMDRTVLRAFWLAVLGKLGATVKYFDNGDGHVSQG